MENVSDFVTKNVTKNFGIDYVISDVSGRHHRMEITGGKRPYTVTVITQGRLSWTNDGVRCVDVRHLRNAVALLAMLKRYGSLTAEGQEVKFVSWAGEAVPQGEELECNVHIMNRSKAEDPEDTTIRAAFDAAAGTAKVNYGQSLRAGLLPGDFLEGGGLFVSDGLGIL